MYAIGHERPSRSSISTTKLQQPRRSLSSHHRSATTYPRTLCERPSGLVKVVIDPGFRVLCDDAVRSSYAAQLRYVFG